MLLSHFLQTKAQPDYQNVHFTLLNIDLIIREDFLLIFLICCLHLREVVNIHICYLINLFFYLKQIIDWLRKYLAGYSSVKYNVTLHKICTLQYGIREINNV